MRSWLRPTTLGGTITTIASVWGAGPVLAHIDPDPKEAPAGSEQSVGFTVEHGCDGSPTIQLDMRLPDGATGAVPEPPAGWTASVRGNVVTFVGGPLADDVEETFRVRMTLPLTPGATIYFPFVQRCEQGEIHWINLPTDSGDELDEPAPAMNLVAPLPTTTTTTTTTRPTTTSTTTATTTTTTTAVTTTTRATTTVATTSPTVDTPTSTNVPATSATDPPATMIESDDGDSGPGTVVFAGVLAALAGVAGVAVWQVWKRRP